MERSTSRPSKPYNRKLKLKLNNVIVGAPLEELEMVTLASTIPLSVVAMEDSDAIVIESQEVSIDKRVRRATLERSFSMTTLNDADPIFANFDENAQGFFTPERNSVFDTLPMEALIAHEMPVTDSTVHPIPTLSGFYRSTDPITDFDDDSDFDLTQYILPDQIVMEASSTATASTSFTSPPPSTASARSTLPFRIPDAPARQPAKSRITKEIARFALGNNRFAVVCFFMGDLKVHIREYSDVGVPLRKGICLTPRRWASLVESMALLDMVVAQSLSDEAMALNPRGEHLGGFVYAKASGDYHTVDIRQYFVPKGETEQVPTKKGIMLRAFEWGSLKRLMPEITQSHQELVDTLPCAKREDHIYPNVIHCTECYPIVNGKNKLF